jgi:hypothetical protein
MKLLSGQILNLVSPQFLLSRRGYRFFESAFYVLVIGWGGIYTLDLVRC